MRELVLVANSGDGTISTLGLTRGDEPELESLAVSGGVDGCSNFAVDPAADRVFAAYKGEVPGIATLHLDRDTGRLEVVELTEVEASLNYLTLTDDGAALLGISYGGGVGMVWPVSGDTVGEPHSRFEYRNLHSIIQVEEYVYAVSLGDDLVAQFRLGDGHRLIPLDPPTVDLGHGCGPRHIIAEGGSAYLVTEYSGEVIRFDRAEDGTLVVAESVSAVDPTAGLARSRMGADPLAEHLIWGADVHVAGSFVLASERTASTIASISRDGERLVAPVGFTKVPEQPRGFAVAPGGDLVVAVGERSTTAQLLRVTREGGVDVLSEAPVGTGANWVRFV